MKFKRTKCCVLSSNVSDNTDADPNNIIFNIKDTKLCVPVVALSAKDNQKLSKLFSKTFERSVNWNEYETKSENKDTKNKYRYFLQSNFVGVNNLLVLAYWTKITMQKDIMPEGII